MRALDESDPVGARAAQRLRSERMGWITTVRADGQPQTSGIWFHWDGADLLVMSRPGAAKVRNVRGNPRVSFNLDGDGVGGGLVIVEGTVELLPEVPDPARLDAYLAKYAEPIAQILQTTPEALLREFSTVLRIVPDRWRTQG
jgi:PPOX class probable F420-dependent enzyme